jgi:hypothetical protein
MQQQPMGSGIQADRKLRVYFRLSGIAPEYPGARHHDGLCHYVYSRLLFEFIFM